MENHELTPKRVAHYVEGEPPEETLIKAAFEGNIKLVKKVVETYNLNLDGNQAPNALGWALITGNEELASYLVNKGANPTCEHAMPNDLDSIICEDMDIGGFELTMRYSNYRFEKKDPQKCLEKYCQEATLNLEILDRLISLGADIHCCNDYALHLCVMPSINDPKDPLKIANSVAALRDRGASMTATDIYHGEQTIFDKALKDRLTECCREILKGLNEVELCEIIRTHREKSAIKMAEKEVERRLRVLPSDILDRYLERASSKLPEFLKPAQREFKHREAQKTIKHIENKMDNNLMEI